MCEFHIDMFDIDACVQDYNLQVEWNDKFTVYTDTDATNEIESYEYE